MRTPESAPTPTPPEQPVISRRALLATTAALPTLLLPPAARAAAGPAPGAARGAPAAPETCELALANDSSAGELRAYVAGLELGTDRWMLLREDGSTYYPESPDGRTPLPVDCSIAMPAAGEEPRVLTLPRMHRARVYVVRDARLELLVDPGPVLLDVPIHDPNDPNHRLDWFWAEFTFNEQMLYANLSYVDMVPRLPLGLTLEGTGTHTVAAPEPGAPGRITDGLRTQAEKDGRPWPDLSVPHPDGDGVRRVIAPHIHQIRHDHLPPEEMPFGDYYDDYAQEVWAKYRQEPLRVDLQGGRGVLEGRVEGDTLVFPESGDRFELPVSRDVFSCDRGPFTQRPDDTEVRRGLMARVSAAFNRSTVLSHADQPSGPTAEDFYLAETTNHWARLVHEHTPIGYAFPSDDVMGDGQPDVSGAAADPEPRRFTVTAR
ncbi:sugar hydrolase [Streptomyces sp. P38-E01]|uniref:Sugar hydrolase n=1 Tax=Streptomyces tardus TaxID=2780544 RepID=A0A949JH58_9ACTN|nr:beta-1,3-glucanase family protein [Streptomyces tardus]MBU7598530.1 sugar hydrolase [Streptomyces tardus]